MVPAPNKTPRRNHKLLAGFHWLPFLFFMIMDAITGLNDPNKETATRIKMAPI